MRQIKTNYYFPDGEQLYLYSSLRGYETARGHELYMITDKGKILSKEYKLYRHSRLDCLIKEVNQSYIITHDISKGRFVSCRDTCKIVWEDTDVVTKEFVLIAKKVFYEYDIHYLMNDLP